MSISVSISIISNISMAAIGIIESGIISMAASAAKKSAISYRQSANQCNGGIRKRRSGEA